MSTSARIDRFRVWLWSNGTSEDIAMFEAAIVESIFAIAGRSPVQFAHVTAACNRAREAGKDPKPTEALGRLLVRSEAPARPAAVKTNAQPKLVVVETVRPKLASVEAEPVERPKPAKLVSIEAARQQVAATPLDTRPKLALVPPEPPSQPEPVVETAPPNRPKLVSLETARTLVEPAPVTFKAANEAPPLVAVTIRASSKSESMPRLEVEPKAAPAARKRIDRRVIGGLVAIPVVAAVALVVRKPSGPDVPSQSPTTQTTGSTTTTVLGARLPAGWHEVANGRFVRGDDREPTLEAYVATVPLQDGTTDDTLLSLARDAERGAIGKLDTHITYRPIGCEPAGARTAACRGELAGGLLLQTYVRAGDRRAAIALFVAKLPLADARRETDAIVAALEP